MIWDYLPYILYGAVWTIELSVAGLGIGFLIGLFAAWGQVYAGKEIKVALEAYVAFFTSVPLLVLLFVFYWGVFPTFGFKLDSLTTSIIVLGLYSSAYQSQIFRGAIKSVSQGQLTAASALGMSEISGVYHVILPQALRISLPGWSNEYATILKQSATCFALGVMEILTRTRYVALATAEPFIPYFFAALLFVVLMYAGTKIIGMIYEKTKIPGLLESR